MNASVDKLLQVAIAEIDYRGKKSKDNLDDKYADYGRNGIQSGRGYTKYGRDLDNITKRNRQDGVTPFYNGMKNGYDWCAMFVDWCFVQAFGEEEMRKLTHHVQSGAGCIGAAKAYYKHGQFIAASSITKDNPPQPGDEIFYGSLNSSGEPTACSHTGIVEKVEGTTIFTIEGNINHSNYPGGRVNRRSDIKITSSGVSGGVCGFGRALFAKYPNPLDFPPFLTAGIIQSEDKKEILIAGIIGGVKDITTGLTLYYKWDSTDLSDITSANSMYIANSDNNLFSFTINKSIENPFAKSIVVKLEQHNSELEDSGTIYGGVDYISNNYIQNLKSNYGCISIYNNAKLNKYSPYIANNKLSFDNYLPLIYDKSVEKWYEIYDTFYQQHV